MSSKQSRLKPQLLDKKELFSRRRILMEAMKEVAELVSERFKSDLETEALRNEGLRLGRRLSEVQDAIELGGYE